MYICICIHIFVYKYICICAYVYIDKMYIIYKAYLLFIYIFIY